MQLKNDSSLRILECFEFGSDKVFLLFLFRLQYPLSISYSELNKLNEGNAELSNDDKLSNNDESISVQHFFSYFIIGHLEAK